MNKSILYALLLITCQSFGQSITSLDQIAYPTANPDWIQLRPEVRLSAELLATKYKSLFDLSVEDELRLHDIDSDKLGMLHYTYQQFRHGYLVEGAEWLMHERAGHVVSINGKLLRDDKTAPEIVLSEAAALNVAIEFLPDGARPIWLLLPAEVGRIRPGASDPAAFRPVGELVWVKSSADNNFSADQYALAWRFRLLTDRFMDDRMVAIDVTDGSRIRSSALHPSCVGHAAAPSMSCDFANTYEVDALTTWYGTVPDLGTTSSGGQYYLLDACDGSLAEIQTYDFTTGTTVAQGTNDWTAPIDSIKSHLTAHWAGKRMRNYLIEVLDRDSYDDQGSVIRIINDWHQSNAGWSDTLMILGNAQNNDPDDDYNTIDIVGHELTHGVNDFEANLVNELEPGALDESFADIFGTASEWLTPGITHDWIIGSDRDAAPIRNMQNPNALNDPDTYEGDYWVNQNGCIPGSNNDDCGVHTNCGVMNYWYYLITAGGSGINDNGDGYNVNAIGHIAAEQIAYRNLTVYLTSMSQYIDAREGSIQAALDLFGCNSPEVEAVIRAWYAVGVGPEPVFDLAVTTFDIGNYDAINAIHVHATSWSVPGVTMEAGYGITFMPNTDVTGDMDVTIIEECDELIPMQAPVEVFRPDEFEIGENKSKNRLKHLIIDLD